VVRRMVLPPGVHGVAEFSLAVMILLLLGAAPAVGGKPAPAETTSTAPSMAEVETPAGLPNLAFLEAIGGLPTDSLAAREFLAAFRGAFTENYLLTERAGVEDAARWATEALANRFRLAEGDAFGDEWRLRVTILGWWGIGGRAPSPVETPLVRARGAGLRVAIEVVTGVAGKAGQRGVPTREDLTFDVPIEPRAAFFAHAGRAVGLLAIESLHHQSGDLDEDLRVRLDRTARAPVTPHAVPAPAR
jgi:hypothetical protein